MSRIVVIGASIAGLGAAVALARQGHEVIVVEREPGDRTPSPGIAFGEKAPVLPQRRHSHAFLALSRNTLAERAPDVLASLLDAGAHPIRFADHMPETITDRTSRPGDENLVALACRRTTFEWVLRRAAERERGISLRSGVTVMGLDTGNSPGTAPSTQRADPSGAPTVLGVLVVNESAVREVVPADLVVDASGRWSPLRSWLEAAGADLPAEERHDSRLVYTSRFYKLRPGSSEPPPGSPVGADLVYCKYGVFKGDGPTFSVTFAIPSDDRELRALLDPGAFQAAAELMSATRAWVDPSVSEPVSDVAAMGKLVNTIRSNVRQGRPCAFGALAVGDAAAHSNPLYGRGCSLALLGAFELAEIVTAHADDLEAVALAHEEMLRQRVVPWVENATLQDRQSQASLSAYRGMEPAPGEDHLLQMAELFRDGVIPSTRSDPDVFRAFVRVLNLLDPPESLFGDPLVAAGVLASWEARHSRPPSDPLGPERDELLARIAS